MQSLGLIRLDAKGLPLLIDVQGLDSNNRGISRTRQGSGEIEVPAGSYLVSATVPGRGQLTEVLEVKPEHPGVLDLLGSSVTWPRPRPERPYTEELWRGLPGRVEGVRFWSVAELGHFVLAQPASVAVSLLDEREGWREVEVEVRTRSEQPLLAQIVVGSGPSLNVSLPAAHEENCRLWVSGFEMEGEDLDPHDRVSVRAGALPGNRSAELAVSYLAEGLLDAAARLVMAGDDEDGIGDRFTAAAFGYVVARCGDAARLGRYVERLERRAPFLPDTAVLRGEWLIQTRDLAGGLASFEGISRLGLPVFTEGFRLLLTRLDTLLSPGGGRENRALSDADKGRAAALLGQLRHWSRFVDYAALTLVFRHDTLYPPPERTGESLAFSASASVPVVRPARAPRCVEVGMVTRARMNKTRRVEVETLVPHSKYGKILKRRTVYYVHDEYNRSQEGDLVEIMETRPISKLKRWRLVRIVRPADWT